ncbi:ankyrin repeat-containing domain protein [Aspergillus avenaceus]|uniref:Ankyrin repeat-containing domain protein n=1 Tax=Aspergillus avenaceus TaxID=36643 RepID=A0A5N6U7N1_ASPAV|nr:ankyrin repeat-containing domain protein [Aspergillus avenaceus]
MAKVLLDYPGSEGTQTDFGLPLLCFAAFDGLENAAQLLIERGGYLHGTDSRYGRNALSWAIFKRNRKVTELLLQTPGLDWDNTDLRGRAPLFISAIANDEKSFKTLRSRGSDVHRPDRFGLTPLFVAVQRGAIGIVRDILENHPLQQEPRDRFGRSLTWWMWATGNTNMRDLVIGYGMQVEDEGQQSKGQTYKHSYLNSIESPCEICTISVDAAGQSMELGSGGRKYRICQICHDFGASNMDFASGRGVSRK